MLLYCREEMEMSMFMEQLRDIKEQILDFVAILKQAIKFINELVRTV